VGCVQPGFPRDQHTKGHLGFLTLVRAAKGSVTASACCSPRAAGGEFSPSPKADVGSQGSRGQARCHAQAARQEDVTVCLLCPLRTRWCPHTGEGG
jgi:hypothetical protein